MTIKESITIFMIFLTLFVNKYSADQSIVLKFGDNSVRIEKEKPLRGEEMGMKNLIEDHEQFLRPKCATSFCLPGDYDKMALPIQDIANTVKISYELRDIIEVNDDTFTITFSMYFGVKWKEPRLITLTNSTGNMWQPINMEFAEKLWIPNIFIYDLKKFEIIEVLDKLAALYVGADDELFLQQAAHVTFLCRMRFERFPVDDHTCAFRVGSSGYNDQQMVFETEKIEYNPSDQNTILDYSVEISKLTPSEMTLEYGTLGNFSITGFHIHLKRHMHKYIWSFYVPSAIFVMVSWVGFLIPPTIVPGRMGVLVTLFLVLANMFNSINANSPTVEGMTSLGIWMLTCILFVFGALVEYSGILYLKLKIDRQDERRKSLGLDPRTLILNKDQCDQWVLRMLDRVPKTDKELARADRISFWLFSFCFAAFNLVFWGWVFNGR